MTSSPPGGRAREIEGAKVRVEREEDRAGRRAVVVLWCVESDGGSDDSGMEFTRPLPRLELHVVRAIMMQTAHLVCRQLGSDFLYQLAVRAGLSDRRALPRPCFPMNIVARSQKTASHFADNMDGSSQKTCIADLAYAHRVANAQ